jgi:outer membrane protein TolC
MAICMLIAWGTGALAQTPSDPPPPEVPLSQSSQRDAEKRMLEIEETIRQQKLEREKALLEQTFVPPTDKTPSEGIPAPAIDPNAPRDPNGLVQPAPPVQIVPTPLSDALAMGEALLLSDVIASTYRAFPDIEIARLQASVASGQVTSATGAYDINLDFYSLNQPVGDYENSRNGLGLVRQLWWGGYAMAGYRVGRGNFEPWYKERETDQLGEYRAGWVQPLLQGRAIDPYRVELFQSNLNRRAVQPEIEQNILFASLDAARAYWMWVEAGNILKSRQSLLDLAAQRDVILRKLFERGLSTRQELSINAQTISERTLRVLEAQQKFRDTAFKLAIFLRDGSGNPMLAAPEWLPVGFPPVLELPAFDFNADYLAAQQRRPELQLISIDIQKLRWDLELARNQLLPNVDFTLQGAQDTGQPASRSDDKADFMLETGLVGGVPIQRRKARGKVDSTLAKIQQTEQKRFLQLNKIEVEIRTARNALELTREMALRSDQLLRETRETLEYFRRDFAAGNRDFLFLLQQEAIVTESEIKLLDAERDYYIALATLQAALGLDPLEQSLNIEPPEASIPPAPMPAN